MTVPPGHLWSESTGFLLRKSNVPPRARWDSVADGRGGAVAIVQRFGGALNLNVHVHALVLDGVFARDGADALAFHPVPRLTALDVAEVLATVEPRITRLFDRR